MRRSNLCPQNLLPGRPPPDLSAPVTSPRHQPAALAQPSARLGPPRPPRPGSLPGVPFPERGFEQRQDVRTLGVQVCRSAFRHLLPLAAAEAAATAAARPGALWEWRPRPRPAGRSLPNRTRGRGERGRGSARRRGGRSVGARALCCPFRSPRAQHPGVPSADPDLSVCSVLAGRGASLPRFCHSRSLLAPLASLLLPPPPNPSLLFHSRWRAGPIETWQKERRYVT